MVITFCCFSLLWETCGGHIYATVVVTYPEGFRMQLYKGLSTCVLSIKAHLHSAFFFFSSSFNADSQMVFKAEAGRRKDWACRHKGSWCHMLQEKLKARRVSELSAYSRRWPYSGTWVYPLVYLPLHFSKLCLRSALSVCPHLTSGLQGDILTVIRRVDEHWIEAKLGEKVGVCPLQFTEVSSS